MTMPTPQPAVLAPDEAHALFLVLRCRDGSRAARVAASTPSLAVEVGSLTGEEIRAAVGLGPELWDRVSPNRRPAGLRPFAAVDAGGRRAPATGGDFFCHLTSPRHDALFELGTRLRNAFGGSAEVLEEVHGFRYLDSRDLTGFIDGTANPAGDERADVALIGAEDPPFAGGSFVATQRYVHYLAAFRSLPLSEQEAAIGRMKADSVELADKPATSHVGRVEVEEDGAELRLLRHSYPYGDLREAGLFFVAYGRTLHPFETMLPRVMGASGDGLHDRLMDFTRAVSGATFFVPSLEVLSSLARA